VEERLELDYQIGEDMKERIILRAIDIPFPVAVVAAWFY
jgi:hypothetical protein